ncbi:MAG: response regulator transcription factor, partial [Bifidobacteriaceae bacterium]|nr:response regulator transcription factor [Bifidobacteriaceae bacterium]
MTSAKPIDVMIVDDHEVVRRGIAEVVERADGMQVVAEAGSVAEALRRVTVVNPQVILVDLRMPDSTGIDLLQQLSQIAPQVRPIVLTSFDDDDAVAAALDAGALAFILKSVRGAEIAEVIRAVAAGRTLLDERTLIRRRADRHDPTVNLTPAERRILDLLGGGL